MKLYVIKYKDGRFSNRAYIRSGAAQQKLTRDAKWSNLDGAEIIEVDIEHGIPIKVLQQGNKIEDDNNWARYEKPTYTVPIENLEQKESIKEDLSNI